MLQTKHSLISSLLGAGSRRSLRDATLTFAGLLPMAALLAVMGVVFCTAAGAQTVYFSGAQITLPNAAPPYGDQAGVAVDAHGNVYVADSGTPVTDPTGAIYEIEAVNGVIPASPTIRVLGSGFVLPFGVAVDASGDVFVADTGNSEIKEILAVDGSIPATPTIRTLGSGFSVPYGVAVDSSGNVFVADSGSSKVKEMLAVGGSIPATPTINILGSGFTTPLGVAVDASGNVFVADFSFTTVFEIMAAGGYTTVNPLGSGFNAPSGVTVDASGNVYVADSGNKAVKEILAAGGSIIELGSGLGLPFGVAVSASGNLYVADPGNGRVVELQLPGGNFGEVSVGATSLPISMTFTNGTAATISLGVPVALTQGVTGLDYAIAAPPGTGTCSGLLAFTAGDSCTVNVTFTPEFAGSRYGAAVLLNGAGDAIATGYLQGVGLAPQVSFLPASPLTLGNGFEAPGGVAVDSSYDIFVADTVHAAVKEIPIGGGPITALGSGFSTPTGVALDGEANIFVSDSVNGIEELSHTSIPAYSTVIPLGSGFSQPQGLAVDGYGNVYVADTGNDAVKELTAVSGYTMVSTLGSGFSAPTGVAVDVSGDVFVADTGNNAVKEIVAVNGVIPASPTIHTLGSGFSAPKGVALDGVGNLYVADTGNDAAKEITIDSGYATVKTLVSGLAAPTGVAVSDLGNLYIVGSPTTVLEEDYADVGAPVLTLAFGSTDGLNVPTADQAVTVQNIGNQPLIFESPATGDNPYITQALGTGFALDSSPATACTLATTAATSTLATGESCTLSVNFDPTATGSVTGTLTLNDNNLNTPGPAYANQVIDLSGTGLRSQTITFTAPVSPLPFGIGPQTLVATASSGLTPVTFSFVSGPGTLTGGNTLTITGVGTIVVAANQAGNAVYAPAQATLSIVVYAPQTAAAPTFSLPAGVYTTAPQLVTILDSTPGATIYYTVNGTTPTAGSTLYTGPVTVNVTETIQAIAVNSPDYINSPVAAATYEIDLPAEPIAAPPTFSLPAGVYTSVQQVTILDSTPLAAIYYTVNGTTPTAGSTLYTGPITVGVTETIQAIAVATGYVNSPVAAVTYEIDLPVEPTAAAPTFALPAGTYALQQSVVILDSTPGATIYYTVNGTTPTPTNGTAIVSGAAVTVSASETVEAMAAATGYINSAVAAVDYIINPTAPDFTVAANPVSVYVWAGQSAATLITVTPLNGFSSAVSFSCSGLPAGAVCVFSPTTVTPAGGAVSTMATVTTTSTIASRGTGPRPFFPVTALAIALCCFGFRKRRGILRMMLLLVAAAVGMGLFTGCNTSVGFTNPPIVTSLVTVTATSTNSLQHTTSFLLEVH